MASTTGQSPWPVGQTLYMLRKRYRLTQEQMGRMAGYTRQWLSTLENATEADHPELPRETLALWGRSLGRNEAERTESTAALLAAAGYATDAITTPDDTTQGFRDEMRRLREAIESHGILLDPNDDPRLRRPTVVYRNDQRIPASDSWPMADEYPTETHRDHLWEIDVRGDCMAPRIEDGDSVWVDQSIPVSIGDVVVVYWRGDWTLKRLRQRNGNWLLIPDNPAFAPIEAPTSELRILGVVVKVIKGKP